MPPQTPQPPTPLADRLTRHGTIPFRDYMAEALYGDEHGFYTQRDQPRLKRETSTIQTTKTIAQTLAEAFARYTQHHEPNLVHHGPGTGRLTRYLLATLPEWMHDQINVTFIEPNLARRTRLLVLLQEFGVDGRVIASPHSLDESPIFLVANERLGTFPVHQLERTPDGWEEVHVRFQEDPWGWEETLAGSPPSIQRIADDHAPDTPTGHRYEVNPQIKPWLGAITNAVTQGLFVVLDRPMPQQAPEEGTIRALHEGEPISPYEAPGLLDIHASVDFALLDATAGATGLEERTQDWRLEKTGAPHLEARAYAKNLDEA